MIVWNKSITHSRNTITLCKPLPQCRSYTTPVDVLGAPVKLERCKLREKPVRASRCNSNKSLTDAFVYRILESNEACDVGVHWDSIFMSERLPIIQ